MALTLAIARALAACDWWMTATLGTPAHSSSTASRKLRALHEPQPPNPVMATVAPSVRRCQSSGSGGTETLGLTTLIAPAILCTLVSSSYSASRKASASPSPLATRPTTAPSSEAGRGATRPVASGSGPLVGSRPISRPAIVTSLRDVRDVRDGLGDRPGEMGEHHPRLCHTRAAGTDEQQALGVPELDPALAGLLGSRQLGPQVGAGVGLRPAGLREVAAVLGADDGDDVGVVPQPLVTRGALAPDRAGQRVE